MNDIERNSSLFLTSTQVADHLCISMRTLWRLVAAGKFPQPVRYNRKLVRWKRSDIDKYIEEAK